MKFLARAWKDSRAVVYAFAFTFATGVYSYIHLHGTPKTHADWTVLGWAAAGIAFSALVRAVDPYIGKIVAGAAKVAFKGGVVLSADDINKIVQATIAEQNKAGNALAKKTATLLTEPEPEPAPEPVAVPVAVAPVAVPAEPEPVAVPAVPAT